MSIRFLFFLVLLYSLFFFDNTKLYSACANTEAGAAEKDQALQSGTFSGCGLSGGTSAFAAEFGTPQKKVDEEDTSENPELTPIEITYYDNPKDILVIDSSNLKFHFFNFKNNATITVDGRSKLDLQLYNNTSDINFNIVDGDATYKGGSTGKINIFLPNGDNSIDGQRSAMYSSSTNIDFLDIQGANEPGDTIIRRGGTFTVGYRDDENVEQKASIVIYHLSGNGIIELTTDSKLVIKHYDVNYTDDAYAIQRIRGRGEVIFDTEIFVSQLELLNATFNEYSKLLNVKSDTGGKHIFNASSEITYMDSMFNMVVNNNSHILIKELRNITEANLNDGSTIELLGEGDPFVDSNTINKIQGDGTLHINPNYTQENNNSFKINDININTLILDDGILVIENSTANYTNTETDPTNGEVIKEEKVNRRIKNITQSNSAKGGELIVQGTLIIDNINYLKKLTVCNSANTKDCSKNVNLSVKNIEYLEELEVNGGNFYLEINHTNYIDPAINVNSAIFNGGNFYAVIQDTNTIKHKNTYTVVSVPTPEDLIITQPFDSFKTLLPDWYSYQYYLSDDQTSIMLDTQRLASYSSIIAQSSYSTDYNSIAMSSYVDYIISNEIPLNITATTFTYLDLLSNNDYDTLASNLNSLIPLSKDKYIETAHFSLKEALEVSKRKGIENQKPYGVWDRREELKTPDSQFWFVGFASDGKYSTNSEGDKHKSMSYQFGYNLYNLVSNNNTEEYLYTIIGGFSTGSLANSYYNSDIFTFNIGNTLDYRDENDIVKLSLLYGLSSFKTEREYFISSYEGDDFADLDKSRLNSSSNTHEFLMDIQYSHEIFVEYLTSFSSWDNVILTPRAYFTPSVFIGEGYAEKGDYSSVELEYYVSTIFESGLGFDFSKRINFAKSSNIKIFIGFDTFYRYYNFPSTILHFEEVSSGVGVDNNTKWAGFVVNGQTGVAFDYKKSQFSGFYKRELANDYFRNIFGISYKYLF